MSSDAPSASDDGAHFTFAELFAGVGGFRLGLEAAGGACVFSCEYCKFAAAAYRNNFNAGPAPVGDVRRIAGAQVPRHDVLAAGFPCQSFSNAGRLGGFDDDRGALFFELVRIIRSCQPRALLLENVRGLLTARGGATLAEVRSALAECGYPDLEVRLLDAALLTPQRRRRVFLVGFRDVAARRAFSWPWLPALRRTADEILQHALCTAAPPSAGLGLPKDKWTRVAASSYYARFRGARLLPGGALAQTLQATYKSGCLLYSQFVPQAAPSGEADRAGQAPGSKAAEHEECEEEEEEEEEEAWEVLEAGDALPPPKEGGASPVAGPPPRFYSARECARLMGFPEAFDLPTAPEGIAHRQLGNAVCPPLVGAIGVAIANALEAAAAAAPVATRGLAAAASCSRDAELSRGDEMCRGDESRCEALAVALELAVAASPADRPPRLCWLPFAAAGALAIEPEPAPRSGAAPEAPRVSGAAYHEPLDEAWSAEWTGPFALPLVLAAARKQRGRLRARSLQPLGACDARPVQTLPAPVAAVKGFVAAQCMRRWLMREHLLVEI